MYDDENDYEFYVGYDVQCHFDGGAWDIIKKMHVVISEIFGEYGEGWDMIYGRDFLIVSCEFREDVFTVHDHLMKKGFGAVLNEPQFHGPWYVA